MTLLCASSLNWVGLNLLNFFISLPSSWLRTRVTKRKYPVLASSSAILSYLDRPSFALSFYKWSNLKLNLEAFNPLFQAGNVPKFKTDLRKQPGFSLRSFGCCVSLTDRRFRLIQSVKSDVAKSDSSYILFFGIHFSRKWVFKGSIQDSKDFERA